MEVGRLQVSTNEGKPSNQTAQAVNILPQVSLASLCNKQRAQQENVEPVQTDAKSPTKQEQAQPRLFNWEHIGCRAKPANQRYGVATTASQKQVYCKACRKQFWTKGKGTEMPAGHAVNPWTCSSCKRNLTRDDFSSTQRTQGPAKKCHSCTQPHCKS